MTQERFDPLCQRTGERFREYLDSERVKNSGDNEPQGHDSPDPAVPSALSGLSMPSQRAGLESIVSVTLGYTKHADGSVSITMPAGRSVPELGAALNAEAKAAGLSRVFYDTRFGFWEANEADERFAAKEGVTYRFRIAEHLFGKPRAAQEEASGKLAPLAAIVLAEACERFATKNQGSLLQISGNQIYVRGLTPGLAVGSNDVGAYVKIFADDGASMAASAHLLD